MKLETKIFLDKLFEPTDLVALSKIEENPPEGQKKKSQNTVKAYKTITDIKEKPGYGFYFCPNPMDKETQREEKNLYELKTIFIDFDDKPLPDFPIKPHYVFSRGERHHHVYWLIESILANKNTIAKYKTITRYMVKNYGADKLVINPVGLIRMPYTTRYKDDKKTSYKLSVDNGAASRYKIEEFLQMVETEPETPLNDFDAAAWIIERHRNMSVIKQGEGRSAELLYIGYECRDWGLEINEALDVAEKINKFRFDPPESEPVIRHQIKSAYQYAKNPEGTRIKSFLDEGDPKGQKKLLKLFIEEERTRRELKECIYVISAVRFIDKKRNIEYTTKDQIDDYLKSKVGTNLSFPHILLKNLVTVAEAMTFDPDREKLFINDRGALVYNRFNGFPEFTPDKAEKKEALEYVETFKNHIEYIAGGEYEAAMLTNYLAYCIQQPGKKIMWAPLIISNTGTGKSFFTVLMSELFGEYVGVYDFDNINSAYTQYLKDKLFISVAEIIHNDKFNFLDRMKEKITGTEITIDEKYARSYTIRNTANFFFMSNHKDAVKIDEDDRRLMVIILDAPAKDEDYYNDLFYFTPTRLAAILKYLKSVDLSKFNPHKRPLLTEYKKRLVRANSTELHLHLTDLLNSKESVFADNVFTLKKLRDDLEFNAPKNIRDKISTKQLYVFLEKNGYMEIDFNKLHNGKRIHRKIWKLVDEPEPEKEKVFKLLELVKTEESEPGFG